MHMCVHESKWDLNQCFTSRIVCVMVWRYGKESILSGGYVKEWKKQSENGMKRAFFSDYSPPLLAPCHFRPLSGQMEVAEWWRDRQRKGGRDGGGCDDGWSHMGVNREDKLTYFLQSDDSSSALLLSLCVCPSRPWIFNPCIWTKELTNRETKWGQVDLVWSTERHTRGEDAEGAT